MQSKSKENIIFIRFFEDEDIFEQLKETCELNKVKTAVVLSGIGQIKQAQLGYFKGKGDYCPESFNKPLEILTISGNICKQKNNYIFHLHTVLSDDKKKAFGGHLLKGKISVTAEIVLLKTMIDVERRFDTKTGLKTLYLE